MNFIITGFLTAKRWSLWNGEEKANHKGISKDASRFDSWENEEKHAHFMRDEAGEMGTMKEQKMDRFRVLKK